MSEPFSVTIGDVELSGRFSRAKGALRALVVALAGHGMTSGYFDGPAVPETSLLGRGARRGFVVWAPDRPGYGSSADVPPSLLPMRTQASLLLAALVAVRNDIGANLPVFIVGHSFGFKLGLTMAADEGGSVIAGIDGSGSGLHYAFNFAGGTPSPLPGDRGIVWGPGECYPDRLFERGVLPISRMPFVPEKEGEEWPDELRELAPRIRVPVRFTFGEHERLWRTDDEHEADLRALLVASPAVDFVVHRDAGHNVSLAHTGGDYHDAALDFIESCIDSPMVSPGGRT